MYRIHHPYRSLLSNADCLKEVIKGVRGGQTREGFGCGVQYVSKKKKREGVQISVGSRNTVGFTLRERREAEPLD